MLVCIFKDIVELCLLSFLLPWLKTTSVCYNLRRDTCVIACHFLVIYFIARPTCYLYTSLVSLSLAARKGTKTHTAAQHSPL